MHPGGHSHGFILFSASKHSLGHFWAVPLMNRVTGLGIYDKTPWSAAAIRSCKLLTLPAHALLDVAESASARSYHSSEQTQIQQLQNTDRINLAVNTRCGQVFMRFSVFIVHLCMCWSETRSPCFLRCWRNSRPSSAGCRRSSRMASANSWSRRALALILPISVRRYRKRVNFGC